MIPPFASLATKTNRTNPLQLIAKLATSSGEANLIDELTSNLEVHIPRTEERKLPGGKRRCCACGRTARTARRVYNTFTPASASSNFLTGFRKDRREVFSFVRTMLQYVWSRIADNRCIGAPRSLTE